VECNINNAYKDLRTFAVPTAACTVQILCVCVCMSVRVGMLMQKFDNYLKMSDITVWLKLQQQDIKPQYYAFRWLTLLLSQEFELPGIRHRCRMPCLAVFCITKCLLY